MSSMLTQTFKITAKQREEAILAAGVSGLDEAVVGLKHNGETITASMRDELLAKCAAGQYVELDVEMTAYEQSPGSRNRNNVRLADNAIAAFAKSAKGKPFLKDHAHRDSEAVGGMITASSSEQLGDGKYVVRHSVKLTEPKAVARALRGLMKTVSVSWRATGPVTCSVCQTAIFTDCYHFPGDRVKKVDIDGKSYFKWDRKGDTVVEWIYEAAEHLETSEVPVPAVPTAKIDTIKAQMMSAGLADDDEPLPPPVTENTMNELDVLKAQLSRALKVADLNDTEKAYFRRLGSADQDAFLSKSLSDRAELLKPVFTSADGTVYTAADDPRLVTMAKRADEDRAEAKKQIAEAKGATLASRASTEFAHLSGTLEQRAALLGAIESITDAETRAACLASVKEYDTKQARHFAPSGSGGAKKPEAIGDADEKLQAMAEKIFDEGGAPTIEQAWEKAVESKEGQALYTSMSKGN